MPPGSSGGVAAVAPLASAIRTLATGRALSLDETADAFRVIVAGGASPAQIAAVLVGLRVKGETGEEIAGVVRVLREAMVPVDLPGADALVDTCGTGGGAFGTFNISTAAAFVAAGAGVPIAKHGNRSFTSRSGSADVLEALGVAPEVPADRLAAVLEAAGIVFLFAPAFHPAMRHVGPVRRELGIPTVMNLAGPLVNPAGVRRQVVGVAESVRASQVAESLVQLGATHALVVHGEPGLDEISPLGPSSVLEVRGGRVSAWVLEPTRYVPGRADPGALAGGEPAENAALIARVLGGEGPATARAAVVLNAAAAILVSGRVGSFGEAVDAANTALDSGRAQSALDALRDSVRDALAR